MPLRKQGTLVRTVSALALSAIAFSAAPSAASAACVQAPTIKAFAKLGDTADYSLAPGGNFESSAGWILTSGAKIVSGNEDVGITTGSKSLSLPLGATATSPEFCVDQTNPYFRFVAKPQNALAGYSAIVLYRNSAGKVTQAKFTSSADASWGAGKWAASKVSPLAVKIPLATGATASVQIMFVSTGNLTAIGVGFWGKFAAGSIGTVSIDSVMVDPYRRG